MAKSVIDCQECNTKSTVTAKTSAPVQCCPFCGNTLIADETDSGENDGYREFDPDSEDDE